MIARILMFPLPFVVIASVGAAAYSVWLCFDSHTGLRLFLAAALLLNAVIGYQLMVMINRSGGELANNATAASIMSLTTIFYLFAKLVSTPPSFFWAYGLILPVMMLPLHLVLLVAYEKLLNAVNADGRRP